MEQIYIFEQSSRAANYGIGMYIKQLSACLLNIDREVNVIYLSAKEKTFLIKKENNIRYFYIPAVEESDLVDPKKALNRYHICAIYLLIPHINSNCRLLFHINYNNSLQLIDTLKTFWPKSKIVLTIHYFEWCFFNRSNTSEFRRIIKNDKTEYTKNEKTIGTIYMNEKQMFKSVDHIICLSQYALKVLTHDYSIDSSKISLIYNGLEDTAIELSNNDRKLLKKQLYFDPKEKIILFAGRLDEIKGTIYLIEAFKRILKKNNKCRLIIAGDGEFTENMRHCSEIWNKVTFTGKLKSDQLYKLYQIADIGVMPSMHEQCSYVAIEMMMFGIPLIASDSSGLDEMIIDGINGYKIYLTTMDNKVEIDINQLIDKIEDLLYRDNTNIKELKYNSRNTYNKKYTFSKMTASYNQVYKSIMDNM